MGYTISDKVKESRARLNEKGSLKCQSNLEQMRGKAHTLESWQWAEKFGVRTNSVQRYARILGEQCKQKDEPPRPISAVEQADLDQARMMAEWATRPIRRMA